MTIPLYRHHLPGRLVHSFLSRLETQHQTHVLRQLLDRLRMATILRLSPRASIPHSSAIHLRPRSSDFPGQWRPILYLNNTTSLTGGMSSIPGPSYFRFLPTFPIFLILSELACEGGSDGSIRIVSELFGELFLFGLSPPNNSGLLSGGASFSPAPPSTSGATCCRSGSPRDRPDCPEGISVKGWLHPAFS